MAALIHGSPPTARELTAILNTAAIALSALAPAAEPV